MKGNFDAAIVLVFASEGGFVDDRTDPGGATKFGITLKTLGEARGKAVSQADVAALNREEARGIYRALYWDRISADELPTGLDYCAFDASVNSGPKQAALWLQAVLKVSTDGVIGPKTLAAASNADPAALMNAYCDHRLAVLRTLSTFNRFGRGWESRVERVRRDALAFVQHTAPSLPFPQLKEAPMDQTQSIFQSRTVWSNLIGFGAFILTLTGHGTSVDTGQLTDSIMQVVTAGSFIASTVFRILSTKKVAL